MEPRHPGLVDRFGRFELRYPLGDLCGGVREPLRADLSRERVERDGSDGTGVDIQAD